MPTEDSTRVRMREMRCLRKTLRDELQQVRQVPFWNLEVDNAVFSLLQKRMRKPGIRSYFLLKVFDYVSQCAHREGIVLPHNPDPALFERTIPFVAETLISVQYYFNQILDQKGSIITQDRINNTLISGNLLRSFLEHYIQSRVLDPELVHKLQGCVSRILEIVDIAQYMDKNWGNYYTFRTGVPNDTTLRKDLEQYCAQAPLDRVWALMQSYGMKDEHRDFAQLYLKRAWLANAPLFMLLSELIMDFMGYNGRERENIVQYASEYGLLVQLANDTNDLLPPETVDKQHQDSFSDLKNGTISLPYLFYFNFHPDQHLKQLQARLKRNEGQLLKNFLPLICNVCIPVTSQFANSIGTGINLTFGGLLYNMRTMGTEDNKYFWRYKVAFYRLPEKWRKRYVKR